MMRVRSAAAACLVLAGASLPAAAQQVADTSFVPDTGPPGFAQGKGPRVALDEAHFNFHTLGGRYQTFARALRGDGFTVEALLEPFSADALADIDVLVVANALAEQNHVADDWMLPTPSAFTPDEIAAARSWVEKGGALFLIADHMPFPGAAHDLAAAFGFELLNGFAFEGAETEVREPLVFRRSDRSLGEHVVTRGADGGPAIDSVATFTGEAFRAPEEATVLLRFRPGVVSIQPDTAWVFHEGTPHRDVGGWAQGAVLEVGRGRVAVFGEAAMFSAQMQSRPDGAVLMGMNAPVAAQNPRFLLNLVRWLAGALQ